MAARDGVPLVLANARMSEKSARGYARLPALFAPAFGALEAVCAQSEDDAKRLRALGAHKTRVAGNLKFDVALDAAQLERGRHWRSRVGRPVLLLASTREGEEKLLLDALPAWDGKLLIVVVPRHPQRFDEVASQADARRTRQELPEERTRIYLGDTMGEMAFYYAACDVAVIGGSFLPLGGQNLIEALAAGAPVVTGPSMFNFAEPTRLALEAGAAVQADDAREAISGAISLLRDPERRGKMSRAGAELCAKHSGATQNQLRICLDLLRVAAPR